MLNIDGDNNIKLTRGDTAYITLEVTRDGEPYDFTNDQTKLTVKKDTKTNWVVFQKTFNGPTITIEPSDTEGLDYQTLKYDVQIITTSGEVFTVIEPRDFTIAEEVNFDVEN